jgi:CHAT domain-containing protein
MAPFQYAKTLNSLGIAYQELPTGDRVANVQHAIQCFKQALTIYTPDTAPLEFAGTQHNLGNAYQDLPIGEREINLRRAIQCYQQSLNFRTPEEAPLDYAMTQNDLGNAYIGLNTGNIGRNIQRAIGCYQQALNVYTPEVTPRDYAMIQNNLGTAYVKLPIGDRGANLQRAIQCYRQALNIYTPQTTPLDYAMAQNNLANAYRDLPTGNRESNLQRAIQCYQQALEIYRIEIWPNRARDIYRHLGATYFATGNWTAAHDTFAQALSLTEEFYSTALLREVWEQEVGANVRMVAQDVFCLAQLGQSKEAWYTLEQGRVLALRQRLDRARARRALSSAGLERRKRYHTLAGRERDLREALGLARSNPRHRYYHEVRDELASVTQELRDLQQDLLEDAGVELGMPDVTQLQNLSLLQDSHTGLLSLALTDHGTVVFLLTHDDLELIILEDLCRNDVETFVYQKPEDGEPGGWLGAYLSQLGALQARRDTAILAAMMPESDERQQTLADADVAWRAARNRWRAIMTETLDALGHQLWPDLDKMLKMAGIERVVLVPQGMLFLLPLHACPLDGTDERVCDRYTVAYAPAGSVLAHLASDERMGKKVSSLLVANPTSDLPYTPSEVLAIQGVLDDSVHLLWERSATDNRILQHAREAGILHFSGHGTYDWHAPEQSGLALPGNEGEEPELLTVAEMRDALHLSHTRLVTLSACETGLTEVGRGLADEYIGLPGVLLQAGARAVVASLWSVSDLATALLMRKFYEVWDQGAVSIAEALCKAQRWLRTRSRAQVKEALDELDALWASYTTHNYDPAMQRRAEEQYWVIREAKQHLAEMEDPPFAHPYWWAAFQAVGDVL